MIVYISIGNSDDRLGQAAWSRFHNAIHGLLTGGQDPIDGWGALAFSRPEMHGHWLSVPSEPWQNACWCVQIEEHDAPAMKGELAMLAQFFGQDSIAWAPVMDTEFIKPTGASS